MNFKKFQPDRLKIRSDLTVYNRKIDPNGNEHSVNNSEKYNKTYSKAWFKTPPSSCIQVRKRFPSRSKPPLKNEETVKIHHKQNET